MGLSVRAFSKLVLLDVVFNSDGEAIDPITRETLKGNHVKFRVNHEFTNHHDQILHNHVYTFDKIFSFEAGSYIGYNNWRERLAKLAEYPRASTKTNNGGFQFYHAASAWHGGCEGMPFVELINFSDCGGVIGKAFSQKLAKDFMTFERRVLEITDFRFKLLYENWKQAFKLASDGGAVKFC